MSSIAGVLSFNNKNKERNVQEFQSVTFLIKVEKLPEEDTQARLFFLDGEPVKECKIPSDIKCKEINENETVKTKNKKIFAMIPEKKRYTIHNFDKPDNVRQYEVEKRINKAINTIIKYE
ncbi:10476_t:CDS:2, partial [Racocetra persica]